MLTSDQTDILAVVMLVSLFMVGLISIVIAVKRSNFTFFQWILVYVSKILSHTIWRANVRQMLNIPPGQGVLIVSNHNSPVDPWFIQLATNRVVHWMVAREYCTHRFLSWFFNTAQSIPVNRHGVDTAATKQAIRYLQQGQLVGMFPEGRINVTDTLLLPGRPGAAMIALAAKVPVLPCYISGCPQGHSILSTFATPSKTYLHVGKIIDLSEYYDQGRNSELLHELTLRFMREIASLAGHNEFKPSVAGKKWIPDEVEELETQPV